VRRVGGGIGVFPRRRRAWIVLAGLILALPGIGAGDDSLLVRIDLPW